MSDLHAAITAYLDHQEACGWHQGWPEALTALRAVVDLHKPDEYGDCIECGVDTSENAIPFPCDTALAIAKAFGPGELDRFKDGAA